MSSRNAQIERTMDVYRAAVLTNGDTRAEVAAIGDLLLAQHTPAEFDGRIRAIIQTLRDVGDPGRIQRAIPDTRHPIVQTMTQVLELYRPIHAAVAKKKPEGPSAVSSFFSYLAAPAGTPPVASTGPAPTPPSTPARPKKEKNPVRFAESGAGPSGPSGPSATPPASRSFATMTEPRGRDSYTQTLPFYAPAAPRPAPRRAIVPDSLAPWWMPYAPPLIHPIQPPPRHPYPTLPLWYLEQQLNSQRPHRSHSSHWNR